MCKFKDLDIRHRKMLLKKNAEEKVRADLYSAVEQDECQTR